MLQGGRFVLALAGFALLEWDRRFTKYFSVLLQTAPEEVWRCGKPPTRPKPLHHQHWRGYSPQAQPQDLGSQFSILICPAAHFDLVLFLFSRGQLVEVEEEKPDAFGALGKAKSKLVVCRICKGDHWTLKCPYKDTIGALAEITSEEPKEEQPAKSQQSNKSAGAGKYVPPSLRGGAGAEKKGESMNRDKGLFSFFSFFLFHFLTGSLSVLQRISRRSVSPICRTTPRKGTCKSCSGVLVPCTVSSWRKTRTLETPEDMPMSAFTTALTPSRH